MWIVVVARAVVEKRRWERWMGVAVVVESLVEGVVGVVAWVIGSGRALGWVIGGSKVGLLYTSPSPRDRTRSRRASCAGKRK